MVQSIAAQSGPLHCLVNNASSFEPDSAAAMDEPGARNQLEVNLLAPLALAALQGFARATGGALPLIAVGGIASGADAYARIRAGASAVQLLRRIPPAPLRPLLAIHLAPASLLATVGAGVGVPVLPMVALALGAVILSALVISARWVLEAGFTAMWGALTFPLVAYASALFALGFDLAGMGVLVVALGVVPVIAWRVITMWGSGQLAAKTNAAEA